MRRFNQFWATFIMTIIEADNISRYPFKGRNLFQEPETYFYSDCYSLGYFEDYVRYRREKISELSLSTQDNSSNERFFTETCNTSKLLRKILLDVQNGDTTKLDRFCVKYETRKKFLSHYDHATLKPKARRTDASFSAYIIFSETLCVAFESTENLKYLSTLLKLNDAVCSLKIPFDFVEKVKRLLELELRYVEQL